MEPARIPRPLTALACAVLVWSSAACSRHSGAQAPAATPEKQPEQAERSLTPRQIADRSTAAIVSVRTPEALGTGFVVHADGWIVTSLHVVGHGPEIVVTFEDGRELPVIEVINGSRQHDLVILRVAAKGLPTLALGDSDRVRAGDSVVAIGHPLGLSDTVSNGLVSAVRQLDSDLEVLQISAPIAPGSSGGPLFNEHGEVIGIATAILQGGQNLNLGLPAKYVKRLMQTPEPISMPAFVAAMTQGDREKQVPRHVPNHPVKLLRGCSSDNLSTISQSLGAAIDVGARLYNAGDFAACYHVYEGAAMDLARKLPQACYGPKQALSTGRKRAAGLNSPSAQAWALRDAFDGLLGVVARRLKHAKE